MVGTGIFVGLGIALEIAAAGIVVALTLAALLALVNRYTVQPTVQQITRSADLDASLVDPDWHSDWLQFTASWTLFLARLTAAATAALGIAGYLWSGLQLTDPIWLMPIALVAVTILTVVPFRVRSHPQARISVILAAVALLGLILAGLPNGVRPPNLGIQPLDASQSFGHFISPLANLLQAAALMSVAYAGYESLPNQTVNRHLKASSLAIVLAGLLYLGVAIVSLSALGALGALSENTVEIQVAPLLKVMQSLDLPGGIYLMVLGAVIAMASTVLQLFPLLVSGVLKLSDSGFSAASRFSAALTTQTEMRLSPRFVKLLVSIALGCIVLVGDVKTIWSFSAFTFLLHTALLHWITLRQRSSGHPRWINQLGGFACLFLAFWVNWDVWLVSLGLVALALIWRGIQYYSTDP